MSSLDMDRIKGKNEGRISWKRLCTDQEFKQMFFDERTACFSTCRCVSSCDTICFYFDEYRDRKPVIKMTVTDVETFSITVWMDSAKTIMWKVIVDGNSYDFTRDDPILKSLCYRNAYDLVQELFPDGIKKGKEYWYEGFLLGLKPY